MRTLRFIVEGQSITLDPKCDCDRLVPGSSGYLQASFSFSTEWDKCRKAVAFFSNLGREYEPQLLTDRNTCIIPEEVLKRAVFKIQIIGDDGSHRIRTNKVTIHQRGGSV